MSILLQLYRSSIGKKIVVGVTGLFLCIYLIVHAAGNIFLFKNDGGKAFNTYAEILPSLWFIRVIEIVLFAVFIGHIATGVYVWFLNRTARPVKYRVSHPQENSSFFSRTMFVTGSIVFIFIVI